MTLTMQPAATAGAGPTPDSTPAPSEPVYVLAEPGRFTSFVVRSVHRLPSWAAPAGVALCAAGGVAYTLLIGPAATAAATQPTCIMKLFTGFDCPGCGGTRAAWFLLHGDIAAAARHHAPMVFATPLLIGLYLAWTFGVLTKRQLPWLRIPNTAIVGFLAVWAVFAVLRNLPWAPFNWFYV